MKFLFLAMFCSIHILVKSQNNQIGNWQIDADKMPCFEYTGNLPFTAVDKAGTKVKLPEDPWFILGNYRMNLFTHVSGEYELVCGQRGWGRVNIGDRPNSGANQASISIRNLKKTYALTGMKSLATDYSSCKRLFGCGYADYQYKTNELECKRTLSVKPSSTPYNGIPAFAISVEIRNTSRKVLEINYTESITANYQCIEEQRKPDAEKKVKYSHSVRDNQNDQLGVVDIKASSDDPLHFNSRDEMSMLDGFPPSVFLAITSGSGKINTNKLLKGIELAGNFDFKLKPGESRVLRLVSGFSFDPAIENINHIVAEMSVSPTNSGTFIQDWKKQLPLFSEEQDPVLKREMTWNAYILEAMAKYSEYYGETKIPQGTVYDYDWGMHASARDNLQHALPTVYYNPDLAKSTLRYLMKRTTPWGEIRLIEFGNGYSNASSYFTSDQQLFFFLLMAEYLRVTKDYAFLQEDVQFFPARNMPNVKVVDVLDQMFRFLRDEVGIGQHGLVRLMNSDWNDAVFYIVNAPYNRSLYTGESHMNSAMAVSILDNLIPSIEKFGNSPSGVGSQSHSQHLAGSMQLFRQNVYIAFMKELGDRKFSKRMYYNGESYGDDNMFLEPQGYLLQFKDLSVERKKVLFDEMKKRVYTGEKLGAREQQKPQFVDDGFDPGSRENGGFWYALNGPVVIGLSTFDKTEAIKMLKMMTFNNFSRNFPQYWTSYWSTADNIESSLIRVEGLPDQTWTYADQPVFCAHPHAWPLYCYYRIKE